MIIRCLFLLLLSLFTLVSHSQQTVKLTKEQTIRLGAAIAALDTSKKYTHHVGEYYQGGIIFKVYKDKSTGIEHGLIVYVPIDSAHLTWDKALQLCKQTISDGFKDWYIATDNELIKLFDFQSTISRYIQVKEPQNLGTQKISGNPYDQPIFIDSIIVFGGRYWTSTSFGGDKTKVNTIQYGSAWGFEGYTFSIADTTMKFRSCFMRKY